MCTVTFVPRRRGYCLAMNRDEQRSRAKGLPPAVRRIDGRTVVYPSEPNGGTWVALNDLGGAFALINWYSVPARAAGEVMSRGDIIPSLVTTRTVAEADSTLSRFPLRQVNPFRLIGIFLSAHEISEWRWDLKRLTRRSHRWRLRQWASSGFDEAGARRTRGKVFRQARQLKSTGTLRWVRGLHGSHSPQKGPYCICMHRDDAVTVSYTEFSVRSGRAAIRFVPGSPCCTCAEVAGELRLIST